MFALRREVAAKQVAMEERDREIAEVESQILRGVVDDFRGASLLTVGFVCVWQLRGSEADLKLRLVRAEASRKLPSAHNTNTNTQKVSSLSVAWG